MRHEVAREARMWADEPLSWPAYLTWSSRFRQATSLVKTWEQFAAPFETRIVTPFWDAGFLRALGAAGGWRGLGDRTAAMGALFGHLLPEDVQGRTTKADMTNAVWGEPCYSFARQWEGLGLDPEVVDHEAVRSVWLRERPYYASATMLHAAWLATDAARRQAEEHGEPGQGVAPQTPASARRDDR
jgi:asparagine synthase (glutamine-hydrolysing)